METINVTAEAETFTCNAYLVIGDRTVLIDAGSMEGVTDVIDNHVDTLDAVLLTHQHGDHVAELDSVLSVFEAPLYAFDHHPHRDNDLQDGDQVYIGDEVFEVIHTPGHADDHVSFLSETSLFSGDVVVHNDSAFDYGSFGRTDMPGQSRDQLIESIETLFDRMGDDVTHLYAGHGDGFHGDVRDVVETALSRAETYEPKYPDE